jgi:hypothetical protein
MKLIFPTPNAHGNLMFKDSYPMREGKFPKLHPFIDNPEPFTFSANPPHGEDRLSKFRQAGYYASCFPEGDGLSFKPLHGQDNERIKQDVLTFLKVELVG